MRTEQEIINAAANLKTALLRRGDRMKQLASDLAALHSGLVVGPSQSRIETMELEYEVMRQHQSRDSMFYATMRWVLGVTENITTDKLELNK